MRIGFRRPLALATCFMAVTAVAACGGSDTSSSSPSRASAPAATSGANIAPPDDALVGDLIGTGCAKYNSSNPTGAGSLAGMAQDPVATAASNNPMLSTLTSALSGKLNSGVNLVDTLNSGTFTVLAPTDAAFQQLDAGTLTKLKTDKKLLANVLTYHVIGGQYSPAKLRGTQSTVEGATVKVTGSGNDMKINGAGVVCGGVKTANATVYLIDKVLMPPTK